MSIYKGMDEIKKHLFVGAKIQTPSGNEEICQWCAPGLAPAEVINCSNFNDYTLKSAKGDICEHSWWPTGDHFAVEILNESNNPNAPKGANNMVGDIVKSFKNIGLSANDKFLLDSGLEDPTGVPTSKGLELSALIGYKANRDEVLKVALAQKEAEDEEKAKK